LPLTCSSLFGFLSQIPPPPRPTLFPYTTLFRSSDDFGRRLKAEAQVLRSRWTDWYIDAPFRIVTVDDDDPCACSLAGRPPASRRSEEHTSELQSRFDLVCRLLLEKKNRPEHTRR